MYAYVPLYAYVGWTGHHRFNWHVGLPECLSFLATNMLLFNHPNFIFLMFLVCKRWRFNDISFFQYIYIIYIYNYTYEYYM